MANINERLYSNWLESCLDELFTLIGDHTFQKEKVEDIKSKVKDIQKIKFWQIESVLKSRDVSDDIKRTALTLCDAVTMQDLLFKQLNLEIKDDKPIKEDTTVTKSK